MAPNCYHLDMRKFSISLVLTSVAAACLFSACSPKFDWRDFRSLDAPFSVLFPGKPATYTRSIDLDGVPVSMTMTASEVDGTTFAVGTAQMPDAVKAQAALLAMKTALVKNIGATVNSEKAAMAATATSTSSIQIEASGSSNGTPVLLIGRFIAQDKRIYQVIVLGRGKHVSRENVDMFIDSFKLN